MSFVFNLFVCCCIDWGSSAANFRETNLEKIGGTPNFALENQPIKRQKLEGGLSRQASVLLLFLSCH